MMDADDPRCSSRYNGPPAPIRVYQSSSVLCPEHPGAAPRKKRPGPPFARRAGRGVPATTYFRAAYSRTIIGDAAFHFRVRHGTGWGRRSVVTRPGPRVGAGSRPGGDGDGGWMGRGGREGCGAPGWAPEWPLPLFGGGPVGLLVPVG